MKIVYDNTIRHHGVRGQKWGDRNGPPYPLDGKDHSPSEKKAGWRKSLDKNPNESYDKSTDNDSKKKKGLTKNQKRAIAIGATAAAIALTSIGAYALYKTGKLDFLFRKGKTSFPEGISKTSVSLLPQRASRQVDYLFNKIDKKESISEIINMTNPYRNTDIGRVNCKSCSVAAFFRSKGYNVFAKGYRGEGSRLSDVVSQCFKNGKVIEGSAVKFGKSRNDAAEMLIKRFGDNADGICSVQWNGGGGHAFNWSIKDGIVKFFDSQSGMDDERCSDLFWKIIGINQNGSLEIARLDNLEINPEQILKWVSKVN